MFLRRVKVFDISPAGAKKRGYDYAGKTGTVTGTHEQPRDSGRGSGRVLYPGSGKGGQKINKTSSCVQLIHRSSGIEIRCQHRDPRRIIATGRAANCVIALRKRCWAKRAHGSRRWRNTPAEAPPLPSGEGQDARCENPARYQKATARARFFRRLEQPATTAAKRLKNHKT